LRERCITTTIHSFLRPGTYAPNVVRVSTSAEDIRAALRAGYGLVIAIARDDAARDAVIAAGADVVLPGFASLPGALLAVMRSPRRLAPVSPSMLG
jgi:hypothetical protein